MPGRLALVGGDVLSDELATLLEADDALTLQGSGAVTIAKGLRDSTKWAAIESDWRDGATLIAFGDAAAALCGYIPDLRNPANGGAAGLGVIPALRVLPYFDTRSRMIPDFALAPLVAPGTTVVGIDDEAALVAEPPEPGELWQFRSRGRQSCWRIEIDRRYRVNSALHLRVST